jgi:hypothetical protein
MTAWLDANCGSDGWAMTPSGSRGVLNDAVSIYFASATLARAFVARWCAGSKVETAGGVFQVREDEPAPRFATGCIGRRESDAIAELNGCLRLISSSPPRPSLIAASPASALANNARLEPFL